MMNTISSPVSAGLRSSRVPRWVALAVVVAVAQLVACAGPPMAKPAPAVPAVAPAPIVMSAAAPAAVPVTPPAVSAPAPAAAPPPIMPFNDCAVRCEQPVPRRQA